MIAAESTPALQGHNADPPVSVGLREPPYVDRTFRQPTNTIVSVGDRTTMRLRRIIRTKSPERNAKVQQQDATTAASRPDQERRDEEGAHGRHLAAMVESANTVKDYGAPGTGFRLIRWPSGKLVYVAARIAIANVDGWRHRRCRSGSVLRAEGLVEVALQRRGLGAPRSALSDRFGTIVINLRYQRLQMPLHEGTIPIFDAAAVIATLQNLEP